MKNLTLSVVFLTLGFSLGANANGLSAQDRGYSKNFQYWQKIDNDNCSPGRLESCAVVVEKVEKAVINKANGKIVVGHAAHGVKTEEVDMATITVRLTTKPRKVAVIKDSATGEREADRSPSDGGIVAHVKYCQNDIQFEQVCHVKVPSYQLRHTGENDESHPGFHANEPVELASGTGPNLYSVHRACAEGRTVTTDALLNLDHEHGATKTVTFVEHVVTPRPNERPFSVVDGEFSHGCYDVSTVSACVSSTNREIAEGRWHEETDTEPDGAEAGYHESKTIEERQCVP